MRFVDTSSLKIRKSLPRCKAMILPSHCLVCLKKTANAFERNLLVHLDFRAGEEGTAHVNFLKGAIHPKITDINNLPCEFNALAFGIEFFIKIDTNINHNR